jgi:hypothetical protein
MIMARYGVRTQDVKDVDPGAVEVTALGTGYYLVQIGRARYTKRLNLSVDEAERLIEELQKVLPRA